MYRRYHNPYTVRVQWKGHEFNVVVLVVQSGGKELLKIESFRPMGHFGSIPAHDMSAFIEKVFNELKDDYFKLEM